MHKHVTESENLGIRNNSKINSFKTFVSNIIPDDSLSFVTSSWMTLCQSPRLFIVDQISVKYIIKTDCHSYIWIILQSFFFYRKDYEASIKMEASNEQRVIIHL
jgi:hypothetical protein